MTKIFVLANTILFQRAVSGGDTVFPQMSKYFRLKHEVHVIGHSKTQPVWKMLNADAVFHTYSDIMFTNSERKMFGPIKYIFRTIQATIFLLKLLPRQKQDVYLYSSSDLFVDTFPACVARFLFPHVRWIARIYHVNPLPLKRKGPLLFSLFSFFAQQLGFFFIRLNADKILVLRGAEISHSNFNKKRIELVDIGVGKITMPIKAIYKSYDAIWIGSLVVPRGMYDVLQIWKRVIKDIHTVRLAIVGGGSKDMIDQYKKAIIEQKLSKSIDFYGYYPNKKDLYSLIKSSKLYLCLRHEGGWDIPSLEAFTYAVPVVAYTSRFFGEVLKKGFVGIEKFHYTTFAKAIVDLLNNDSMRNGLSRKATDEAKRFSWEKIAIQFEKTLQSI